MYSSKRMYCTVRLVLVPNHLMAVNPRFRLELQQTSGRAGALKEPIPCNPTSQSDPNFHSRLTLQIPSNIVTLLGLERPSSCQKKTH